MRKLFAMLAVGAFVVAGQASAATLSSASFAFQLGTLPGATFTGVGATGTATSNLSASLGAGSAFAGNFTTGIPTSAAPPLTAIQIFVTKNAGGTFSGTTPNNVGGNHVFNGTANVYGIGGFTSGGAPLLAVPLVLVAPTRLITNVAGTLAAFSTLTLTYVPEPGTLLLLGAGVAGLTAIGRRKS